MNALLKSHFTIPHDVKIEEEYDTQEDNLPKEEEVPQGFKSRKLNKSEASQHLSMIGKTDDGDNYAYLKIDLIGMKLTNVNELKSFRYVRYVNVSDNLLTTDAIQPIMDLPYILFLRADTNLIEHVKLKRAKYLQVIIINNNAITTLSGIYHPNLYCLELANNSISVLDFSIDIPDLKCLDLRLNLLRTTKGIIYKNLDSLYLAGNNIKKLEGLNHLRNLRVLHLRGNPLKKLEGLQNLRKLQYLNLRECRISKLKQIKKLQLLPNLQVLVLIGCPYMSDEEGADEEEGENRIKVIAALQRLIRLNKNPISKDERDESLEVLKSWLEGDEEEEEEEDELEEEGEVMGEGGESLKPEETNNNTPDETDENEG